MWKGLERSGQGLRRPSIGRSLDRLLSPCNSSGTIYPSIIGPATSHHRIKGRLGHGGPGESTGLAAANDDVRAPKRSAFLCLGLFQHLALSVGRALICSQIYSRPRASTGADRIGSIFSRRSKLNRARDRSSVNIGGARVMQGDIMVGDSDGVGAISKSREEEVLATAEQINEAEEQILELLKQGKRLDEARKELQYHKLQTPDEGEGG